MPEITRFITAEDLKRASRASQQDLSAYTGMLEDVRTNEAVGGYIQLFEGESQRAEKRRFTLAAKQLGLALTWRTAPDGELRFVLAPEGEPAPGGRTRRVGEAKAPTNGRRGRPGKSA